MLLKILPILFLAVAFFVQRNWQNLSDTSLPHTNIPRDAQPVHVFMCADNGTFSGLHEMYYIRRRMEELRAVQMPDCQSAFFGYLTTRTGERLPSLAITTGIYVVSATACTLSLMSNAQYKPESIVFLGTSGISPTEGGWNPSLKDGCAVLRAPRKNALGSVCVTDAALLQECGICVEDDITSECSRPNCVMHETNSYFGNCSYRHPTSMVAQMLAAMEGKAFPTAPEIVQKASLLFWGANAAVEDRSPPLSPRLLRCAETDTSQILAGARSDILCREYSHALIPEVPPEEHTCVQAMEGFGFLHVMSRYPNVPIALIRAGSNYDMYPMSIVGENANGSPLWAQNDSFIGEVDYDNFTRASYRYAVLTSSSVVLNYYIGEMAIGIE